MEGYLYKMAIRYPEASIELPAELEQTISNEFITENDCIILKGLGGNEQNPKFESDLEKCEWEYNETHFHPDEYSAKNADELDFLLFALESSKRLAHRLQEQFPTKAFRIVASFCETHKDHLGRVESYGSSTVRFYQIRRSYENRMRSHDISEFQLDAISEIEIGPSSPDGNS